MDEITIRKALNLIRNGFNKYDVYFSLGMFQSEIDYVEDVLYWE